MAMPSPPPDREALIEQAKRKLPDEVAEVLDTDGGRMIVDALAGASPELPPTPSASAKLAAYTVFGITAGRYPTFAPEVDRALAAAYREDAGTNFGPGAVNETEQGGAGPKSDASTGHAERAVARASWKRLQEFDAWPSFAPDPAEILPAFRKAFGTDTSAAADASTGERPEPWRSGHGVADGQTGPVPSFPTGDAGERDASPPGPEHRSRRPRCGHVLKTIQPYFDDVAAGRKMFEVRRDDRPFEEGDELHLREWLPDREKFTGRQVERRVSYVLRGGPMPAGFVAMGLEPPDRQGEGEPASADSVRGILAGAGEPSWAVAKRERDDAYRERDELCGEVERLRVDLREAEHGSRVRLARIAELEGEVERLDAQMESHEACCRRSASLLDALRNPSNDVTAHFAGWIDQDEVVARNVLAELADKLVEHGHAQEGDGRQRVEWARELVATIRQRGTEWADPPDALGPLHEAISERASSFSSEFWTPEDVAHGCADFVAWLLLPDGLVEHGHAQEGDSSTAAPAVGLTAVDALARMRVALLDNASDLSEMSNRDRRRLGEIAVTTLLPHLHSPAVSEGPGQPQAQSAAQGDDGRQDAIDAVVNAWRSSAYVGGPTLDDCARLTLDRLAPFASPDPQSENPERAAEREGGADA